MNDKIKVKLDPDEYRGWKLSFAKSHDRESDFPTLTRMGRPSTRIARSLCIGRLWRRRRRPAGSNRRSGRCGWPDSGSPGWQAVEIHTIIGNGFHFRTVLDGEEHFEQMRSVSLDRDQNRERKLTLHSDENIGGDGEGPQSPREIPEGGAGGGATDAHAATGERCGSANSAAGD